MTQLYTTYADLYHKMYRSLIDYDAEYQFYKTLVDESGHTSLLELGCGTGQLAKRFVTDGYKYTGIDVSDEMLNYAKLELPEKHFHLMDMRAIELDECFDAVIITARSISYLITNDDLTATFRSVRKILKRNGKLIFDFIDARNFIPQIKDGEEVVHVVTVGGTTLTRESIFEKRIEHNWCWTWRSRFLIEDQGSFHQVGIDNAKLRAFTADEMDIFLQLCGFRVNRMLDRKTYAFDTKVAIAESTKV